MEPVKNGDALTPEVKAMLEGSAPVGTPITADLVNQAQGLKLNAFPTTTIRDILPPVYLDKEPVKECEKVLYSSPKGDLCMSDKPALEAKPWATIDSDSTKVLWSNPGVLAGTCVNFLVGAGEPPDGEPVEIGEPLREIVDRSQKSSLRWGGPDCCSVVREHPKDAPTWLIALREIDKSFRGRAINDKLLSEMRLKLLTLLEFAAAAGDLTKDESEEVKDLLGVARTNAPGIVMVTGIETWIREYEETKRQRVKRDSEKKSTEEAHASWYPRLVEGGFYTRLSSNRLAMVLGKGRKHETPTSSELVFMQWADTNEMFYVPVSEFLPSAQTWVKFNG